MPQNVFDLYRLPQNTSNNTIELVISLKTLKEGILMGLYTFFYENIQGSINEIPLDASKCSDRFIY